MGGTLSDVASIAVILAAVIATATFLYSVHFNTAAHRSRELREWQKVAVHQILQKNRDPLSFDEILRRYRSEATAAAQPIASGDLSAEALRRILLELIDGSAVVQLKGDSYQPADMVGEMERFRADLIGRMKDRDPSETRGIMHSMIQMLGQFQSDALRSRQLGKAVLLYVWDRNGKCTRPEVVMSVSAAMSCDPDEVEAEVADLVSDGKLSETDNGALFVTKVGRDEAELQRSSEN